MNTLDRNELLTKNFALLIWAGHRASRITRGRLSPEDGVSAVALAVVKRWDRFDPTRGKFTTWVAWVARSVACRHLQDLRCECRDANRERGGFDFARIATPEREDHALPDAWLAHLPKLMTAVAALPRRNRDAVVKRFGLDGLGVRPLSDIDPAVGREAARVRVRRGLRLLREILEGRRPVVRGRVVPFDRRSVA